MAESKLPEPWLRGTLEEYPAVPRAVLHALELAREDIERWCDPLSEKEMNARPGGIAPVAFHLRHIARSLDRLLTYAEGGHLNAEQTAALDTELGPDANRGDVLDEVSAALAKGMDRIRAIDAAKLEEKRRVGKKGLPTTVGGLLVHVADHTQRHVGQAITTAKIARAMATGGKT